MKEKTHALLAPSSASRWLVCTPSARLEETFPDVQSEYAKEGQLAHQLAELILKYRFEKITDKEFNKDLLKIKKQKFYNNEMYDFCFSFVELVEETYQEAKYNYGKPVIYFEQHFDLSAYIEEGYGTTDVSIIAGKHLIVLDLKYGKGVPVYAEENKQGMLYALGAFKEFEFAYDIEIIDIIIFQPRIDNNSRWAISAEDLLDWAEIELKSKAELAFDGQGEFVPGGHCQFCRAKANCKALHDQQLEIAKYEFDTPALIPDEDIPDILDRLKGFEVWIAAVKEYALEQAIKHGKKWKGFKLVQGRSNRKYTNEAEVLAQLKANGFKQKDVGKFYLHGITEMERLLGKKRFEALLGSYLIKPPGKPTLVSEKDPRPSLNTIEQAQKEFEDSLEDDYLLD